MDKSETNPGLPASELISKRIRPNEIVHISVKDDEHLLFEQGAKVAS